ncbi:Gfo/Idh/MocA family protein [Thermodesulfobacteriota bacterium]
MGKKLRIALIGCGSIGSSVHLRNLKKNKAIDITALIDSSEKNLSQARRLVPKASTYNNSKEFFKNEKLEAVIIATPPDSHRELTKSALSTGMAVYLEKPLGIDLTEGEELVSLANSIKTTTMLGFNYRFNPVFAELRKAIANNIVGEIRLVRTMFTITREHAKSGDWRGQSLNGVLSDLGSHHFDLLRHLFQLPVTSVSCANAHGQRNLLTATLHMLIDDRIPVQSHFSFDGALENRVEIFGSEGGLIGDRYSSLYLKKYAKFRKIWDFMPGIRNAMSLSWYVPRFINYCLSPWGDPSYRLALDAFVRAVGEGIPAEPDFEDGLYALRLVDAAENAIRKGTTVHLNREA